MPLPSTFIETQSIFLEDYRCEGKSVSIANEQSYIKLEIHCARKEDATARIPNIVLDLLFEHIGEMIVPFGAVAKEHRDSFYLQRDTNRMLKKLPLVHRTWTPYSQNLLRRRLIVSTQTKARSYLQSPLLGPWVQELALH